MEKEIKKISNEDEIKKIDLIQVGTADIKLINKETGKEIDEDLKCGIDAETGEPTIVFTKSKCSVSFDWDILIQKAAKKFLDTKYPSTDGSENNIKVVASDED